MRNYLNKWLDIHLFNLPPYSPEYNPVELIWKWLKSKVYGFSFIDKIVAIVRRIRKYVWHFNAGKLINPIELKLETYSCLL